MAILYLLGSLAPLNGQEAQPARDSTKSFIALSPQDSTLEPSRLDTLKTFVDQAALDIAEDRGLYIITADRRLQLRILGSVRFHAIWDNQTFPGKNGFNTFLLPLNTETKVFRYINSLDQTRLGFEITRNTRRGDVFIRLETDFAGKEGAFRIRHAYGQFGRFLFGQTWSLFGHLNAFPPLVDFEGPAGNVSPRNPQIRYIGVFSPSTKWYVALEYVQPEFVLPDSLNLVQAQFLPDLTGRIDWAKEFGQIQLSWVFPFLSAVEPASDKANTLVGWGISASALINKSPRNEFYFQCVAGRSISKYIAPINGAKLDLLINPETEQGEQLFSWGGYIGYGRNWLPTIRSYIVAGIAGIDNPTFQPGSAFKLSYSLHINTFFAISSGARLGVEAIYGRRVNKDWNSGDALRLNLLAYYDF